MRAGAGLLCLPLLLAACSGAEPAATADDTADSEGRAAPVGATSELSGTVARETGGIAMPAAGMRANVSALTGATSDLNVRITDMGTVIDLPSDALFEYDKSALTPDAEGQLRKAADLIRRSPPVPVRIIGHTDSHGGDAYNQTLSEARARAVAAWFGQQPGVRNRAMEVLGEGKARPIAPNQRADGSDDPQGRARNRRVEVVIPTASRAP